MIFICNLLIEHVTRLYRQCFGVKGGIGHNVLSTHDLSLLVLTQEIPS